MSTNGLAPLLSGGDVPTTLAGFLVILSCALPGYVYIRRRARRTPELSHSAFEELLTVLFAGTAVDLAVVIVIAAVWTWTPVIHPDAAVFISQPRSYVAAHLGLLVVWTAIALGVAVAVAYVIGGRPWENGLPWRFRQRLDASSRRHQPQQSAWWLLFREHPDTDIYVGCLLEDGSYVAGMLHSYSRAGEEHQDRELTLRGDIMYRAPGESAAALLTDVNAVAVSSRRLSLLTVTYVRRDQREHGAMS